MRNWLSLGSAEALVSISTCLVLAMGCTSVPPHPVVEDLDERFSSQLVRAHRASMAGLYPRLPESRDDRVARGYLRREFRLAGANVREIEEGGRRHLVAELEGASDDLVLLVGTYPSLETGDQIDDSSAVLMLELARVFGETAPPYTLEFALAEVRPEPVPPGAGDEDADIQHWQPISNPREARRMRVEAGESLARAIEAEGRTARIRAVITFDISDRDWPRIARDLRSHPGFRKVFWDTAQELGFESIFPVDGDWASPASLHLGFRTRSMDRVLALVELAPAGSGPMRRPASGVSRGAGLDAIGLVSVESITRLMRRFEKVDAFAR
jgi:hypothetical protein